MDVHIKIEGGMSASFRLIGALEDYTNNIAEVEVTSRSERAPGAGGFAYPPEIVALVLVDDQPVNKDYIIQEGDRVQLLAVIGGG